MPPESDVKAVKKERAPSRLADFFAFRAMIYPVLIQYVIFPIWVVASVIASLLLAGTAAAAASAAGYSALGFAGGLGVFVVVFPLLIVLGRVPLEVAIVLFRMYDRLTEMSTFFSDVAAVDDTEAVHTNS